MRYLFALFVACLSIASACKDDPQPADAGMNVADAGRLPDASIDAGVIEKLERPPGALERPPANGLPAELYPPR